MAIKNNIIDFESYKNHQRSYDATVGEYSDTTLSIFYGMKKLSPKNQEAISRRIDSMLEKA